MQRRAKITSFTHADFPLERLEGAGASVSVCLPARDEARTIGHILRALIPLRERGVVGQVVVVDDSRDGTGEIARSLGAEVHDQGDLMPELGPVLGKGDAMYRALSVLDGEIICYLDADSEDFGAHYVLGLVGPLLCDTTLQFVKGFYRRPFRVGGTTLPQGGGRVTELTARPLLRLFLPELADVRQPLAGEIAIRRSLVEQLPFVTGYGVDVALLIDAHGAVGSPGIAQVDLDVRQNAHQPLGALAPMADAVLHAVATRLVRAGRLDPDLVPGLAARRAPVERTAFASLRAAA